LAGETRDELLSDAQALASEQRWEEAAPRFEQLGELLLGCGEPERAHGALAASGDAAWRGDLLSHAVRCFVRSRELVLAGSELHAIRGVQLAAVLLALGELQGADLLLQEVEASDPEPKLVALLLDTRMGLELVRGRCGRVRADLVKLESLGVEGTEPVLLFREGQLATRDGRFSEAVDAFSACSMVLGDGLPFAGPLGAALLELAEVAIFREDDDDALALLQRAADAWKRAGRRSGQLRVEAARMRLLSRVGSVDLLTRGLERGVDFARERQHRLLELDLRLTLGSCTLGRSPQAASALLSDVAEQARRVGAFYLRGRALLALHDRDGGDQDVIEQACLDLVESLPWRTRAYLALARAMGEREESREQAMEICATALCRFASMDLPGDEQRARSMLWRFSLGR